MRRDILRHIEMGRNRLKTHKETGRDRLRHGENRLRHIQRQG